VRSTRTVARLLGLRSGWGESRRLSRLGSSG
jgi:hypothetical protein